MKNFKIVLIIFTLFLFGCNQTNSENASIKNEETDKDTQTHQQETSDNSTDFDDSQINNINNIIILFKEKAIPQIAENHVDFPLNREYPIQKIENKEAFKKRFNEVFDENLIEKIVNSDIKQWSKVGYKGIMLDNGTLWLDDLGEKIIAVNYQSDLEKTIKEKLITNQKNALHASLSTFKNPVYKIKTKNYLIRIDELVNNNYRYASWKINKKESSKPDIIIKNGIMEFQGSGGNHDITFSNLNYSYVIYRNILGTSDTPEVELEVKKDGKTILSEAGQLIAE